MGESPACSGGPFSLLSTPLVVSVTKTVGFTANWRFSVPLDTDDVDPVATGLRINGMNGTYVSQVDANTIKVQYGILPVVGQAWAADTTAFSAVFVPPGAIPPGQTGVLM